MGAWATLQWLADATHTFIFISCIARSTQREYTARVLLRCAHTQCMLHSLPTTTSLHFKLAHIQIVPDAPHDDCALCATRSYCYCAGALAIAQFQKGPSAQLNNTVTTAAWCLSARVPGPCGHGLRPSALNCRTLDDGEQKYI